MGRTLEGPATADAEMTSERCVKFCFAKGYPYAGTEYHTECYCGTKVATGGSKAVEGECSTPCGGNATQACGGPKRLTLYQTTDIVGPTVNPELDGWVSVGCYS